MASWKGQIGWLRTLTASRGRAGLKNIEIKHALTKLSENLKINEEKT